MTHPLHKPRNALGPTADVRLHASEVSLTSVSPDQHHALPALDPNAVYTVRRQSVLAGVTAGSTTTTTGGADAALQFVSTRELADGGLFGRFMGLIDLTTELAGHMVPKLLVDEFRTGGEGVSDALFGDFSALGTAYLSSGTYFAYRDIWIYSEDAFGMVSSWDYFQSISHDAGEPVRVQAAFEEWHGTQEGIATGDWSQYREAQAHFSAAFTASEGADLAAFFAHPTLGAPGSVVSVGAGAEGDFGAIGNNLEHVVDRYVGIVSTHLPNFADGTAEVTADAANGFTAFKQVTADNGANVVEVITRDAGGEAYGPSMENASVSAFYN